MPGSTSAGHGGFIDFHYNNSQNDNTGRIIGHDNKVEIAPALTVNGRSVETRVLLWSNSNGSAYGTDPINLISSDYDTLEVHFTATNGASSAMIVQYFAKGRNITLFALSVAAKASDSWIMYRSLERQSDTYFTCNLGRIIRWGTSAYDGEFNYFAIPRAIYGLRYY